MKKLFIFMLCLMVCVMPCLAVEEGAENVTESTQTTEVTKEATTETTTKKEESTTKKSESTTKEEKTTKVETTKAEQTTKKTEKAEIEEAPRVGEVQEDLSQPRLMVTGYNVDSGYLTPEKNGVISINIKNMHHSKSVRNIKLSIGEETEEICPEGLGTEYVSYIGPGNTYTWNINVKTAHNATVGVHKLNLTCEYEDKNGTPYSENATLRVEVRQPVKLVFDGAILPVKVVQEDTVTLNINLMNTGKSTLYNCKVEYDIEGLESGGSSFAGEISVGESKTATVNLRVDSEKTGNVKGTIKITYEDAFGKTFEKEQEVKTLIEKKVIKAEKKEEEEKKNPLWWLFILIGLIAGGGAGFGIPFAINSKKQREEDEKRL